MRAIVTREHKRRGGAARASHFAHVVEGGLYTSGEIAKRIGVSPETARRRASRGPYPLTWASLETPRIKS